MDSSGNLEVLFMSALQLLDHSLSRFFMDVDIDGNFRFIFISAYTL